MFWKEGGEGLIFIVILEKLYKERGKGLRVGIFGASDRCPNDSSKIGDSTSYNNKTVESF